MLVAQTIGKESACNLGDLGLIPESRGSPEKGMATHSSIIAWRIPWTEEPHGLQSLRLQRTAGGVGLNVVTKTTTNNTVSQIIQETGNNPLTLVLHAFIRVCARTCI